MKSSDLSLKKADRVSFERIHPKRDDQPVGGVVSDLRQGFGQRRAPCGKVGVWGHGVVHGKPCPRAAARLIGMAEEVRETPASDRRAGR